MTGKNIIIVGLQPWDMGVGSNCKNIAVEFARNNRVLYVNAPLDTNTKKRGGPATEKRLAIRASGGNLIQVGENIWNLYPEVILQSINWLPDGVLFDLFNKRNNRRMAGEILDAAGQLRFDRFILFNDSDMLRSFYLQELLQPELSIYYSRDNLMAVNYWNKHGRRLEPALMKKSTLVCANSVYLKEVAGRSNPHSFYVGQGCDLALFDSRRVLPVPEDMKAIKKPIIGYMGAIVNLRLDLELLLELCRRKPEWSFVFVGKADQAFTDSGLAGYENVHFLGMKKEDQLPDYLAQFDVAINPQRVNGVTIGNYPRKIDEYLAMGKPVVATDTPTMSVFAEYVYVGRTADDYISLLGKALEEKDSGLAKRKMEFAATHTWPNSVKAIYDAIEKTRQKKATINIHEAAD